MEEAAAWLGVPEIGRTLTSPSTSRALAASPVSATVTPAPRQQQLPCHISNLEGVLLPLRWQRFHVILAALT